MVIFIAGLVGTGKTTLARHVGEELSIYHYDVDRIKAEIYPRDPSYSYNLENKIPFSDEIREKVFERVVEDFKRLATHHKHIIVDEILHKKNLRQILFVGAKKYFGAYIIVWVKVDDGIARKRLAMNRREGHLLQDPFDWYLVYKKQYEDFERPDIVYNNNKPIGQAIVELIALIRGKIDH